MEINKVYCKDNLEVLKSLPDGVVDLIYCDILYGTGRNFGDYQDLKSDRRVIEEHYIPRIQEMHRVLKDTGSIYLQCDYRINHWIRCIMDDIFGYGNFRNEIIWCYKNGGASKSNFSNKHDNIYWYSKSKNYKYNLIKEKSYLAHRYGFKGIEEFKDEDGWYTMVNPKDYWNINPVTKDGNEKTGYSTQKPKALLERIIKASSNEGDLVADFYCGSGTSLVVAKESGRNYIGCDINQRAVDITEERLKKIILDK